MKNTHSSWPFKLDYVHSWAYIDNYFSKEECNKIINIANKKGLDESTVRLSKDKKNKNPRKSKVCWLYPDDDMQWVYRKITDAVINLNEKYFNFDLYGIEEGLQFANYKAPSGKFDLHTDSSINIIPRKLSITVQLTDPKKYKGGELWLHTDSEGDLMKKDQGTLIIFPSYVLHEVKPVTQGERNALVCWVTGKPLR